MQQPEIKFINKIIRIRRYCEKTGGNKLTGVMKHVNWLDKHIKFNGYTTPEMAKGFLKREMIRIAFIIPSGKTKLFNELKELAK